SGDRFKYTSRDWDGEVGLQYNRARYYDPVIGRWIVEDPIGFKGGDTNLYRYVGNAPANSTDPFGLILQFPLVLPIPRPAPQWGMDSILDLLPRPVGTDRLFDTQGYPFGFMLQFPLILPIPRPVPQPEIDL